MTARTAALTRSGRCQPRLTGAEAGRGAGRAWPPALGGLPVSAPPPDVKLPPALDLFERAHKRSRDAAYLHTRTERMEAFEGVRGASLTPFVAGTRADVNGTARVDARTDFRAMARDRLAEDYAVIDYACAILYGKDNTSGISVLLSSQVADLLWITTSTTRAERPRPSSGHSVSQLLQARPVSS